MIDTLSVDIEYVNKIAPLLLRFHQKEPYVWNCRCPHCGDSKKSKTKARGYIHRNEQGQLRFTCHNCNAPNSIGKLIEQVHPGLYSQYVVDAFVGQKREVSQRVLHIPTSNVNPSVQSLSRLDYMVDTHEAVRYLLYRKIPRETLARFYYCDDFHGWLKVNSPEEADKFPSGEPRIIIPFWDRTGTTLTTVQGRSLPSSKTELRYATVRLDANVPKVYGLDTVSLGKPVKIVEGPIDSIFVNNCIATADGSLVNSKILNYIGVPKDKVVLIFDNERENKFVVQKMKRAIENDYSIMIWPRWIKSKDINQTVIDYKINSKVIDAMVNRCTVRGLEAQMAFADWVKPDFRSK
jgi:hypothetical protein